MLFSLPTWQVEHNETLLLKLAHSEATTKDAVAKSSELEAKCATLSSKGWSRRGWGAGSRAEERRGLADLDANMRAGRNVAFAA